MDALNVSGERSNVTSAPMDVATFIAGEGTGNVCRKRVRQACRECRAQKLRCSADIPECERCHWKGIQCTYEVRRKMHQAVPCDEDEPPADTPRVMDREPSFGPTQSQSAAANQSLELTSTIDSSKSIIQLHIDAFFQYVYAVAPFDFIHRGSLMRTWHKGTMSRSLTCAVAGVASRFMDLDVRPLNGICRPGPSWCDEAERDIICDMDLISIPKLQILLLLIFDRVASGKMSSAWYLAAQASRIVYGLRLNHPTEAVPFTNQECRRRLAWCTYYLDKILTSTGLRYPPLCPRDSMIVPLPCNSRSFDLELECATCFLDEMPSNNTPSPPKAALLGSTAYLIRILDLQDQVKTYLCNWDHDAESLRPWNSGSLFMKLRQDLIEFSAHLPSDTQDNERSIYIRGATPQVNAYVMIQTRLHTCFCQLFGIFWMSRANKAGGGGDSSTHPTLAESSSLVPKEFITICRASSVRHAKTLNSFWSRVHAVQRNSRRFFVTDWGIAAGVYENTETLIMGWDEEPALFDHEAAAVEEALKTNLEILSSLAEVSSYVEAWVRITPFICVDFNAELQTRGQRNRIVHLIAVSAHVHILDSRPERRVLSNRSQDLKLDVEDFLREARRVEDARFPRTNPPNRNPPLQQSSSPRDEEIIVNSTITEGAHQDTQTVVTAWAGRLENAGQLSQFTGITKTGPFPQLQPSVESESPIPSHNRDPTSLVASDFAMPLASSADWAQINYLDTPTSGNDQFGFYAEGLYGEDDSRGLAEHVRILGMGGCIQAWMGT
ncbi:hypothetical protein VE02_10017 [Pseudogymnoascus sp. 03VT05]|nr:hypothetical protein VE02_10017 [Pseudogymnoascus sp. 03VT05]